MTEKSELAILRRELLAAAESLDRGEPHYMVALQIRYTLYLVERLRGKA